MSLVSILHKMEAVIYFCVFLLVSCHLSAEGDQTCDRGQVVEKKYHTSLKLIVHFFNT